MKHLSYSRWVIMIAIISSMILVGCANLAPVRTFADETKKLSATFDPMLEGSTSSCIDNHKRKKLYTASNFDPEAVEKGAIEKCGSINDNNKVIAEVNTLLEQYADTLTSLADDKLPSYKNELNGLKDSLGKIKKSGTDDALVNSDKLKAITSLTEILSRIATQGIQKEAIRDLINNESAINAIASTLNDYATYNYKSWLNDEIRSFDSLYKVLDEFEKNEPLAVRYQKLILHAQEKQLKARLKTIDKFVNSVAEMKKSNSELSAKFDQMDNKELIDQILKFASEVSDLRMQMNDAF